jgi:hypothetical protein
MKGGAARTDISGRNQEEKLVAGGIEDSSRTRAGFGAVKYQLWEDFVRMGYVGARRSRT